MSTDLNACAAAIHREIKNRFLSPHGIIYDYAGLDGEVLLPTPEECRSHRPNALGWWSPIEDGAFFTGIYLIGQCDRHRREPTLESAAEIRRLVGGLYLLQDVGHTPGMIARGVGSDGRCHYACSSNDQNMPWLLGLTRYLATDIPDAAEREECRTRLLRQLRALRQAGWVIPGEGPGFERGSMLHEDGLEGSLSAVHLAAVTRLLADFDPAEASLHRQVLTEKLRNGKTRLEIIANGFTEFQPWHGWFTATSQYAVRELCRRETDPRQRELYRNALRRTGRAASAAISRYRDFDSARNRRFTPDWRVMLAAWKPQASSTEAVAVASAEIELWHQASPAIEADKSLMMSSLSAAWIVMMSMDRELIAAQRDEIAAALRHFDYSRLHYAAFFYGENVIGELADPVFD